MKLNAENLRAISKKQISKAFENSNAFNFEIKSELRLQMLKGKNIKKRLNLFFQNVKNI